MAPPKPKECEKDYTYFYADFEADATKNPHVCFMCCIQDLYGVCQPDTFIGTDSDIQLLEYLIKFRNPVVYFHNLKYDFSFLAKHGITKAIQKGTRLMRATVNYKDIDIQFRDTLPILSCKLSQLPSMFNLPSGQKEMFPYKYYTIERLETNKGIISEAGKNEDKPWAQEQYKQFEENIDKIPGCRLSETEFDMYKYAEFYCQQDVTILREAFNKFASDFTNEFNINPFDFISISSLANEVFNQNVYYPNGNLYTVGGQLVYSWRACKRIYV